jgi:glycogen debranching enzyme
VGTVAALETGSHTINYDQIFTRDFFVSGLAYLLADKYEIVKNFLFATSDLQQTENSDNCFQVPRGLMPASFKVVKKNGAERLVADFGEQAIGRVTPVDSSLWWLFLIRMYIGPGRMDFRFLTMANLLAVLTSLATKPQQEKILNLIESKWRALTGNMPMKLCYPAFEGKSWHLVTGADSKNTPWSYHNGGNWPTLLWLLTAAALKTTNKSMATTAMEIAAERLAKDDCLSIMTVGSEIMSVKRPEKNRCGPRQVLLPHINY